ADFNSNTYWDWMVDHIPQMYLMQEVVAAQIADFEKFPPRQKPASFNLDDILRQMSTSPPPAKSNGAHHAAGADSNGGNGDGNGDGARERSTPHVAAKPRTRGSTKAGQPG